MKKAVLHVYGTEWMMPSELCDEAHMPRLCPLLYVCCEYVRTACGFVCVCLRMLRVYVYLCVYRALLRVIASDLPVRRRLMFYMLFSMMSQT